MKEKVTYETGQRQSLESSKQGNDGVEWNHCRLDHFWAFLGAESHLEKPIANSYLEQKFAFGSHFKKQWLETTWQPLSFQRTWLMLYLTPLYGTQYVSAAQQLNLVSDYVTPLH